jgi:serine/threonine protein phosphatase PrpC
VTDEESLLIAQTSLLKIIHTAAQETGGYSTFTGFYLTKHDQAAYLHAGDSSLILHRHDEIHHITSLHNPPHHPNQLLNFVGGEHEIGPRRMAPYAGGQFESLTEWGFVDLQDGDRLILVTDGVTSLTDNRELLDIEWLECIHRNLGAQALANDLMGFGRLDDTTAVVLEFGQQK